LYLAETQELSTEFLMEAATEIPLPEMAMAMGM